jgi:hypothetical protein
MKSTVRDDLRKNPAEGAGKSRIEKRANDKPIEPPAEPPRDTYSTIVIDPPWPMANVSTLGLPSPPVIDERPLVGLGELDTECGDSGWNETTLYDDYSKGADDEKCPPLLSGHLG